MNKNVKILSALIVGLMGLSYTTINNHNVKNNDRLVVRNVLRANATDNSGAIVNELDEAPAEGNLVSDVKAQISTPVDGKVSIRFVAGIDTYSYDYAAFNISLKNPSGVVQKSNTYTVSSAYLGVEVSGDTKTAAEVFGEGYNYLIAYTITDVPSDYWDYSFDVTASIGSDAESVTTSASIGSKNIVQIGKTDFEKVEVAPLRVNCYGEWFMQVMVQGYQITDVVGGQKGITTKMSNNSNATCGELFNDGTTGIVIRFDANERQDANKTTGTEFDASYSFITKEGKCVYASFKVSNGSILTLDKMKTNACSELDAYPSSMGYNENLYDSESWTKLQSFITDGKNAINAATTFEGVKLALAEAKANIDSVEQRDLGIDEAKTLAVEELTVLYNSIDSSKYTEENYATITSLFNEGIEKINAAQTEDEITSVLDTYKTQINAVEKNKTRYNLSLGTSDPHGGSYLIIGWGVRDSENNLVSTDGDTYKVTSSNLTYKIYNEENIEQNVRFDCFVGNGAIKIIWEGQSSIETATYTVYIRFDFEERYYDMYVNYVGKKATVLTSLPTIDVEAKKTEAIAELESYVTEDKYTSENWALVQEEISKGTTAINTATTIDEVNTALNNAKKAIDNIEKDNLGEAQPISIDGTKTKIEGAGVHIYLADKPNLSIEDINVTIVSFESTQFAGYKDSIMNSGFKKIHYIVDQGWLYGTVVNGFPNDGDQVMIINVSYTFEGVLYSQDIKFVSNAYSA